MSQNDLVETFWTLQAGEFSESEFFGVYKDTFRQNSVTFDEHVEAALASLYLQKLVRNNVISYVRGRYVKYATLASEAA